jgi:hypothetical protein
LEENVDYVGDSSLFLVSLLFWYTYRNQVEPEVEDSRSKRKELKKEENLVEKPANEKLVEKLKEKEDARIN